MTDEELIEQLRLFGKFDPDQALAADRIEQLVIEVDETHEEAMSYLEMWGAALAAQREAEAKLAKAIDALRLVVTAKGLTDPTEYGYETIVFARAVLAELGEDT